MANEVTQRWFMFYREVDMCYYLYNGVWPVCITQPKNMVPWTKDDINELPVGVSILNEVLSNNRKKTFTIDKQRYVVVCRGVFLEE